MLGEKLAAKLNDGFFLVSKPNERLTVPDHIDDALFETRAHRLAFMGSPHERLIQFASCDQNGKF